MSDYNKLRITLIRIASGRHEDGYPLNLKEASRLAKLALENTEETEEAKQYQSNHKLGSVQ